MNGLSKYHNLMMNEPKNSMLSARRARMIEVLHGFAPEWASRADLARVLNKRKLQDSDVIVLDFLIEVDLVEAVQVETGANIPLRWQYRLKP